MKATSVDEAVDHLEKKILDLMNISMPTRTITLSTRDPDWMTPLVKSMLKTKQRIPPHRHDKFSEINERISQVISLYRRHFKGRIGSRNSLKNFGDKSQRSSSSSRVTLNKTRLYRHVNFFLDLCHDDKCVEPAPVVVDASVNIPEVTEMQVWNTLRKIKTTATGPDCIPYWIWRDHAEILTEAITKVWNLLH